MKRCSLKLLLFLLVGAIINLGVAMSMSLKKAPTRDNSTKQRLYVSEADNRLWRFDKFSVNARTYLFIMRGIPLNAKLANESRNHPDYVTQEQIPAWSRLRHEMKADDPSLKQMVWVERAIGFPSPSLYFFRGFTPGPPTYKLDNLDQFDWPTALIFPGFAINTIFYAAILYALFAVPGAVRRRLRYKRGQCAACGYSLRGSASTTCPECGKPV